MFNTNSVIFRTNPVTFKTKQVTFRTDPVTFRTKPVQSKWPKSVPTGYGLCHSKIHLIKCVIVALEEVEVDIKVL